MNIDKAMAAVDAAIPRPEDFGVSVFAEDGSVTIRSLDAWQMSPIW